MKKQLKKPILFGAIFGLIIFLTAITILQMYTNQIEETVRQSFEEVRELYGNLQKETEEQFIHYSALAEKPDANNEVKYNAELSKLQKEQLKILNRSIVFFEEEFEEGLKSNEIRSAGQRGKHSTLVIAGFGVNTTLYAIAMLDSFREFDDLYIEKENYVTVGYEVPSSSDEYFIKIVEEAEKIKQEPWEKYEEQCSLTVKTNISSPARNPMDYFLHNEFLVNEISRKACDKYESFWNQVKKDFEKAEKNSWEKVYLAYYIKAPKKYFDFDIEEARKRMLERGY